MPRKARLPCNPRIGCHWRCHRLARLTKPVRRANRPRCLRGLTSNGGTWPLTIWLSRPLCVVSDESERLACLRWARTLEAVTLYHQVTAWCGAEGINLRPLRPVDLVAAFAKEHDALLALTQHYYNILRLHTVQTINGWQLRGVAGCYVCCE